MKFPRIFGVGNPFAASVPVPQVATAPATTIRADASTTTTGPTPEPGMVNAGNGNYHEALRSSKDRTAIPQAMIHMRPHYFQVMQGLNRKMAAAISRYLIDNGGVASYAVNQIANYSVPILPQGSTDDPVANTEYENFFALWSKQADYTRRFTFADLQRIACIAIDADGDIGACMDGSTGAPKVRMYSTFRIGNMMGLDKTDGVERDANDVVLGYKVIEGSDLITGKANRFIPLEQMILLRDIDRYENFRGWTSLKMGSNDLRDRSDIKAFTKLKEKLGAALGAVIQQTGIIEEDVWGNNTGSESDPGNDPSEDKAPSQKKLSLAELLGGEIMTIDGELKLISHQSPGANTLDFLDFLAGEFVCGLGIPPAFFLDEKLTGPNVRAVLGKIQRKFDNRKEMISRFVEFAWVRVIGWGIDTKQLRAVPNWEKVGFQFQPLMTIDLGDQMANEREDVSIGQMSRQARHGNAGRDWQRVEDQITREDDYVLDQCIKQSQRTGVPLDTILLKRGFSGGRPPIQQGGDGNGGKEKQEKKK
ncbi:MAG: hypothetical protein JWM68_241 [Verrucomicrobiales bacterium]|nr:hypothetical protein [Verrucomicrobiales bacterium]